MDYATDMLWPDYTEEQLDQIAAHREQILEIISFITTINGITSENVNEEIEDIKKQ